MLSSIIHIESSNKKNKSFGTGFIIDCDQDGSYVLTCQHVLDEVETAMVEEQSVEIVASSDFLDMAVIYVKTLREPPLPLQLASCNNQNVHAFGFASFSRDLVQKKEIQATLFEEVIELHSKVDDSFYVVRRIKANEDYTFERGNSGAPLLCKRTGAVIAMISNKEGSNIAYAIEIASLQEIWKNLKLLRLQEGNLHKHQAFYEKIDDFIGEVEENFEQRKNAILTSRTQLNDMNQLQKEIHSLKTGFQEASKFKYYLGGIASMLLILSLYYFFTDSVQYRPHNYKIIKIPVDDVLNIREHQGIGYQVIGTIPYNGNNIAVIHCEENDSGQEWCKITYGNITGWVSSKYIEKEPEIKYDITPEKKNYFRTIANNAFLQFTYPLSAKQGEVIPLSIHLQNLGAYAKRGDVTLSFPQRPQLEYQKVYSDFENITHYKVNDIIYNNHKDQNKSMHAIHPSIEANKMKWDNEEQHIFGLAIKAPKNLEIFRIKVRASLTLQRPIPNKGTLDQQAFFSKEIRIKLTK
ncbi:MAG: Serine/threonine kinase [uncultured Sulfurovum sp.]|uniref:Serine/threonine kinase n=1 Tax=uncultured Sulfurovum sp. TaxID=269237 RepID=A0A6S6SBJ2_9BACT|nr:MAG: Serine/threonine kinase [uncultured Sulfurovum sp.]